MVRAEEQIAISRPYEVVFSLSSDVPRMPAWRSTVVEAAWDDEGPSRVGRPMQAITKVAGRHFPWNCQTTDWDPPRLFGYVARGVGDNRHDVEVRFGLEPVVDGGRLTMAGGGELPGESLA